jgi:hypothetical protein
MKRMRLSIVSILTAGLLAACSGGGGGDGVGSNTPAETATITGVVSGTTVLAVDQNGDIVSSDDTAGRTPDIDRDGDGIAESYSITLSLSSIPVNTEIRVYLISGGNVYPIYFDSDLDGIPDTNVFSLGSVATIPLGFMDIDSGIAGQDGRAIPTTSPLASTSAVAGTANPVIPMGINTPDTTGLSLSELNTKGLNALGDGWVLGAKTYFAEANAVAGSSTSNDADTARFFHALFRVLALGFDTLSDGDSSDLGRLGDLLDEFGFANDELRSNSDLLTAPASLPAAAPTGDDLQNYLYDVVRPEIQAAVNDLGSISADFNVQWDWFVDDALVETDHADALFLSALYKSILASIASQRAYDLDADIAAAVNPLLDSDITNDTSAETIFSNETSFLSLRDTAKLAEARDHLNAEAGALEDLLAALLAVQAETDPQDNDLITLGLTQAEIDQEVLTLQGEISAIQASINDGTSNPILNLEQFFSGVDFRSPSDILPVYIGNTVVSYPDPTLGGLTTDDVSDYYVLPDPFVPDGIPDFLNEAP